MLSATTRRTVRGLSALALAGCCVVALATSPAHQPAAPPAAAAVAPSAEPPADPASAKAVPGDATTGTTTNSAATNPASTNPAGTDTPVLDDAARAARAADIANAASRSERMAVGQAPAARRVIVSVRGHLVRAWTRASSVGDVLADLHVRLAANDVVRPALASAPRHAIVVTRVVGRTSATHVPVAFPVTRVADASMLKGRTSTVRAGRAGERTRVWSLTYANGKLTKRTLVSSTVTTQPVAQLVHYGTRVPRPVVSSGVGGYPTFGGLNWHGLAHCESGNDPHSHDGPYHGLYQFLLSTWQSVGGSGDPADASIYEQTRRAWILYQRDGRHPWPVCGKYL